MRDTVNKQLVLRNLAETLAEPVLVTTNVAGSVATTQTRTFYMIDGDTDSGIVAQRTVAYIGGNILSASKWAVTNAPTISAVATNRTDDAIGVLGFELRPKSTEITITGTNLPDVADAAVRLSVDHLVRDLHVIPEVVSVNGGKTSMVCKLSFHPSFPCPYFKDGTALLTVSHKKTELSADFEVTLSSTADLV